MDGQWIGIIEGTNKGQIVLTLSRKDDGIKGFVVVYDIRKVSVSASLEILPGSEGVKFTGKLYDFKPGGEGNPTTGTIEHGEILEDGLELKGTWKTNIGTGGSFHAFKKVGDVPQKISPSAFLSKPVTLPTCRLDVNQLDGLLGIMRKDINPTVKPSFTINYRGSTYFKIGIEAFVADKAIPRVLNDLTIHLNEHNEQKGYRIVNVSFSKKNGNSLTVTGDDSTWVNGRAREIEDFVSQNRNGAAYFFSKWGKDINFLIFIVVLAFLPAIQKTSARVILLTLTVFSLWGLLKLYESLFPNAIIYLTQKEQAFLEKHREGIIAGVITTITASAVLFVANFFSSHWEKIATFFGGVLK